MGRGIKTQTLRKMKGHVGKQEDFPITQIQRPSVWRNILNLMIRSGKPYCLDVAEGDNPNGILVSARGSLMRYLPPKTRLDSALSDNNGRKILWLRLMRTDRPFEYYKKKVTK